MFFFIFIFFKYNIVNIKTHTFFIGPLQQFFSINSCFSSSSINAKHKFWGALHGNCIYILYTKIMQDVYNWFIQNGYIQNVYNISTNFCIHFVYKIKRIMAANFLYKTSTKVSRNWDIFCIQFVYILHTSILIYKTCAS